MSLFRHPLAAGQPPAGARPRSCFGDESGASLLPVTHRTWAPRGHTPVICHHFKWKRVSLAPGCATARAAAARNWPSTTSSAPTTPHADGRPGRAAPLPRGQKATLLWDGLPAHRSTAMRAWLATQRSWLVVERLPAYAPELNPVEGLWSSLKAVELVNLTGPTLAEVIDQAHRGIDRVRRTPDLAYSFLRHAGLSVS